MSPVPHLVVPVQECFTLIPGADGSYSSTSVTSSGIVQSQNGKWIAVVRAAFVPSCQGFMTYRFLTFSRWKKKKQKTAFLIYGTHRHTEEKFLVGGRGLSWSSSWEEPGKWNHRMGWRESKSLLVQPLAMSRDIFNWIRSLRASSRPWMFLEMRLPPLWATCAIVTKLPPI